jgi:DNA-directed RNA polymerase specialized sigma24 family protein
LSVLQGSFSYQANHDVKIPAGLTERDVLEAIEKAVVLIVRRFAKRLSGRLDKEDLAQQVRLWALEGIASERFNPSRGRLDAFLFCHCKNRASNYHRDHVHRHDPPCGPCSNDQPCGPYGQVCDKFKAWRDRNTAKWAINKGIPIECTNPDREPNLHLTGQAESSLSANELSELIDAELSLDLRADYLRMRDGLKVPKYKRVVVQRAVTEILERHGVDVPVPANVSDESSGLALTLPEETGRQRLVADGQGNISGSSTKSSEQSEAEEATDPPPSVVSRAS